MRLLYLWPTFGLLTLLACVALGQGDDPLGKPARKRSVTMNCSNSCCFVPCPGATSNRLLKI